MVGFEVDVIERNLNQFSGAHGQAWQGFRPLTIGQQGVNFMRRCTEPLDLLEHVPDATEHGDGTVEVFEQMLEVDNDVIDRFTELLLEPLLHGPAGQPADGTRRLWYLAFQQGHDFRGQEMAGRCSDMIDRSLNHLQGSFDRSVKHRNRVAEASSVFETFQHWA